MGGNRRGFPLQDKAATDVQARYPNGKEGYYQVWKDCKPSLTKEFGKITPTLLNIIQVARDKAALGVGRETVAKEDGRMDKDMLGGWGKHTNQVCVFISDNALIFVPGLLPTSFVGSSLFSLCQCWRLCPWPRHLQVNFRPSSFEYAGNIRTLRLLLLIMTQRNSKQIWPH